MVPCLVFGILLTFGTAAGQFDPGCSFADGQCMYNIKLGHEGQCDTPVKRANSQTAGSTASTTDFQVSLFLLCVLFYELL